MNILAIDPGTEESAYVRFDSEAQCVKSFGKVSNDVMLVLATPLGHNPHLVIEMVASYGMPVGAEVFETVFWAGRFVETWSPSPWSRLFRREVKLHLCGQPRAKDGNIRQALIDRWGGKAKAIGTKRAPGPLYGLKSDLWQALAVAVTYSDMQPQSCDTGQAVASGEVSHV